MNKTLLNEIDSLARQATQQSQVTDYAGLMKLKAEVDMLSHRQLRQPKALCVNYRCFCLLASQ